MSSHENDTEPYDKAAQVEPPPGPYSIGSKHWPGLSKLIEEAGEVQQVCGKIIGAGGKTQHWDGSNLRTRLEEEMADVMAACWFVLETNHYDNDFVKERMERKLAKFREWHQAGIDNRPQETP